jgi:hypothetical protein
MCLSMRSRALTQTKVLMNIDANGFGDANDSVNASYSIDAIESVVV